MITRSFTGAARAATALIGIRIAAESQPDVRPHAPPALPPAWLAELDEYEDADELSLVLHSELGEMHRARVARAGAGGRWPQGPCRPCAGHRRFLRARAWRRGRCRPTTP